MARRIKEEPEIHRNRIATAAGELFESKGVESTSMDEVAKKSGYSKATLYVYFKNKDELVGYLVLKSMIKLKNYLQNALNDDKSFKKKYLDICHAMVLYQEEYPYYFSMVLENISIDFENSGCEESLRKTFRVGEEINNILSFFFKEGIKQGILKTDTNIVATIFSVWGMLSGLIQLTANKEEYIFQEMKLKKSEFLERGFEFLYGAIENK